MNRGYSRYGKGFFRGGSRGRSSNVDRSNLLVINANNSIPAIVQSDLVSVPILTIPEKTRKELLKKHDDLDEISDTPLGEDSDDLESVSDGSFYDSNEISDENQHSVFKDEVPVGYRKYKLKYLQWYKPQAFFRPKWYDICLDQIIVGCKNNLKSIKRTYEAKADATCRRKCGKSKQLISSKTVPEPVRGKLLIQDDLNKSTHPLLGLEYLVEVWNEIGISLKNYLCMLCGEELEKELVVPHFNNIPHRILYLDKHFPKFTSMFFKNTVVHTSDVQLFIENISKDLIDSEIMFLITTSDYVILQGNKLKKMINSLCEKDSVGHLVKELVLITEANDKFPMDLSLYSSVEVDNMTSIIDFDSSNLNADNIVSVEGVDYEENNIGKEIESSIVENSNDDNINDDNISEGNISEDSSIKIVMFKKPRGKHQSSRCYRHHTKDHHAEKIHRCKESCTKSSHRSLKVKDSKQKDLIKDFSVRSTKKCVSKKLSHSKKHGDKTASKYCVKCAKRGHRVRSKNKQHTRNCECKKSATNEKKQNQKDCSSKDNSSHALDSYKLPHTIDQQSNNLTTKKHGSNIKKGSKNVSKGVSKDVSKGVSKDVSKDVSKGVSKDVDNKCNITDKAKISSPSSKAIPKNHSQSLKQIAKIPVRLSPLNDAVYLASHRKSTKVKEGSWTSNISNSPHKHSRSPCIVPVEKSPLKKKSKSPFNVNHKRAKSPGVLRRRSRTPLRSSRHRSPIVNRYRSRSPFKRRSKSPLKRKTSISPYSDRPRIKSIHTRQRLGLSLVNQRYGSSSNAVHKKTDFSVLSVSHQSSKDAFNHKDVGSSISLITRIESRKCSSRLRKKRTRSPEQYFAGSSVRNRFLHPLGPSESEQSSNNISPQSFPPDMPPISWPVQNPNETYNYNYQQQVTPSPLPIFPPPTALPPPQLPNSFVPQIPYYPNTAFPPPVNILPPQHLLPQPPNYNYVPPGPVPSVPQVTTNHLGNPQFKHPVEENIVSEKNTQNDRRKEEMFNELHSVVTKLFAISDANTQSTKSPSDSKNLEVKFPFTSFGVPDLQKSSSIESKATVYVETAKEHKMAEFKGYSISDEIIKNAARGIFPENVEDNTFQLLKKEQEELKEINKTVIPDMKAKVIFKESPGTPSQRNIFPIVKQDALPSKSPINSNNCRTDSPGNHLQNDYKQINDLPKQNPNQKTLAQRLASVLVKLGMVDVSGELLAEMLRKIGAFNQSLPLHDITEDQILLLLDKLGYLKN